MANIEKSTQKATIISEAYFSECGRYRYWLKRVWDDSKPIGAFVLMNPSKADSIRCDPTVANCTTLAANWGWGGFFVVNLFAWVSTDPEGLSGEAIVGPMNDDAIKFVAGQTSLMVLAWGRRNKVRASAVRAMLKGRLLYCLKKNLGGGFLHPGRIDVAKFPSPVPVRS